MNEFLSIESAKKIQKYNTILKEIDNIIEDIKTNIYNYNDSIIKNKKENNEYINLNKEILEKLIMIKNI